MSQPLSYSITSLAPDDVNQKFLQAKKHFNNFFNNNTPTKPEHFILKNVAHVTLKRLFYLKAGVSDDEVRNTLTSIQFPTISITADKLELFRTEKHGNVLVALVHKTPELQKLHDELSALIDTFASEQDRNFEKETYNPHLSILYRVPEEQIEEAKQYAAEHLFPISYTLNSFLFMRDVSGVVGEREMIQEYFAK